MSGGGGPGARWVELLLRLHPREFRDARGDELREAVLEERAHAARSGAAALASFWIRITIDLVASASRLRLRPPPRSAGSHAFLPPAGRGARAELLDASAALLQDLRHALRALRATPLVTTVIVLTLAVGVGLNVAIFSVVDAVLLRDMEYRGAERLVQVAAEITASGERTRTRMTGGEAARIAEGVAAFEETAAVTFIRQNMGGAGLPRQVSVGWASGNFFSFLGVEPLLGRAFTPGDPAGTLLLTHALWQEAFGADPGVLGRTVTLDGSPHAIVGVLPPGFRFHLARFASSDAELWKNPDRFWQNGDVWGPNDFQGSGMLQVVGRLRNASTLEQARSELAVVASDVRRMEPARDQAELAYSADYLQAEAVSGVRPILVVLFGAVAGVLLIACANVTGLLLVRSRQRVRELVLRRALGASRGRLVRLLLLEGAMLALAGGGAGALLASAGTDALAALAPPFPRAETVAVDGRVLLFALALSLGCTLVVGLVPALGASRADGSLEARGRRVAPAGNGARHALVVAQIAVSLVLLVGTGLLTSTLMKLRSVDPGFEAERVLTFAVSLPGTRYDWPSASGRFLVELEARIRGLPGVEHAGIMWPVPLSGSRWAGLYEGGEIRGEEQAYADYRVGTAGYFAALGVPVREGRLHEADDRRETVVVSARVADLLWPGQAALGRSVRADPWGGGMRDFEVIGVVEDVRYAALREEPAGALYFDVRGWSWTDWEFDVVVRARQDPLALVGPIREVLADLDPEIPLADPTLLTTLVERQTRDTRFALSLVGLFSTVAAFLALLGLYGVLSYAVGLRTREIGVRMALGSARRSIYRLVLGQALRLTGAGVVVGVLGALWLTRFLGSLLFDVRPSDPGTYAVVASGVALAALLASWAPARRAVRIDPAEVLRGD